MTMDIDAEIENSQALARVRALMPAVGASEDPLYLQLAHVLRRMIEHGDLRGGEALPSERGAGQGDGAVAGDGALGHRGAVP
jgi:hypothetical protein